MRPDRDPAQRDGGQHVSRLATGRAQQGFAGRRVNRIDADARAYRHIGTLAVEFKVHARHALADASRQRDQVRLEARTAEADRAKRDAEAAQAAAQQAQAQAQASLQKAEAGVPTAQSNLARQERLVGSGATQAFPPAATMAACLSRGIGLETMTNAASKR